MIQGFIICVEANERDVIYNFRNDFIAKVFCQHIHSTNPVNTSTQHTINTHP